MTNTSFIQTLGFLLSVFCICFAKRGFILTAPKLIDAGSTVYFTISLFEVPSGGYVNVMLLHNTTENGETVISSSRVFVRNNFSTWIRKSVPPEARHLKSVMLKVQGNFSKEGYEINEMTEIKVRDRPVLTFIQPDKPVYKPGQTVRFRIMPLDSQLLPLTDNPYGDIWIEDANKIRVLQWKRVDFSQGIAQFEFPLSEEPVLGSWSIQSKIQNTSYSQTFSVRKYILPKFGVKIVPPSFIMADAKEFSLQICAEYTYGKKVNGRATAKITYESRSPDEILPSVEYESPIAGCTEFNVVTDQIQFDKSFVPFLKLFAEVQEDGTEIVQNATETVELFRTPLIMSFLELKRHFYYFKPVMPYHGKLQVLLPNYEVASSEVIEVCANVGPKRIELCSTFISDQAGMVNFTLIPQPRTMDLVITAKAVNYENKFYSQSSVTKIHQPYSIIRLALWYSPSDSYLKIEPMIGEFRCGQLERVTVQYATYENTTINFYHQVISRGRILQMGSHKRSFDANVETKSNFAEDVEDPFVSLGPDNRSSNGHTSSSDPSYHFGQFKFSFHVRPSMAPVSRLLVFYIRQDGEVVADSQTFDINHCMGNQAKLHFRYSQQYPNTEAAMLLSARPFSLCGIGIVDKSIHLMSSEETFSREKVFEIIEMFDETEDFSDILRRNKRLCFPKSFPNQDTTELLSTEEKMIQGGVADAEMAFYAAGLKVITDFNLETLFCRRDPYKNYIYHSSRGKSEKTDETQNFQPKKLKIRSYFPETWLWELHRIGSSGEMALKKVLPHTITEWVGMAVCVHSTSGLGISDVARITSYQPFFVSFTLPYSLIRGEETPIIASVFNYMEDCLPIKLSLGPQSHYTVINGSGAHKMCVCSGKSESYKFHIKPLSLGKLNVTVYAYSLLEDEVCGNEITARLQAKDALTRQLLVEAEGLPRENNQNLYFCLDDFNNTYNAEIDLLLPEDVVEGSARAQVSITGDIMGSALNGLDNLVRMPSGCGEQNMVLFTPNIFVLDYLTATRQFNKEVERKALNHMRTGYQRELNYRHSDGSYSAFGNADSEGSIWLTAYVVKSFAQARRFIDIDESDLSLSTAWIVNRQFENGCFEHTGEVLHQEMKGGLKDKDNPSLAPLTAFILISLLESGFNDDKVLKNALQCIQSEKNPDLYALALFAYASALAKSPISKQYIEALVNEAIVEDNMMHWKVRNSKASTIEIAAYAILSIFTAYQDQKTKAAPIVSWLIKQQNANGGYVSTQDTVVSLQSLAKYGSYMSGRELKMRLQVESDDLQQKLDITENNKLLMHRIEIPTLPTIADFHSKGKGCVLAQFTLKYNVDKAQENSAFDLRVKVNSHSPHECINVPSIEICMRYGVIGEVSNMVVVEAKMVSGFVVKEESLNELLNDKQVYLKRYEVNKNMVNFYFPKLSNEETCFQFLVEAQFEVLNAKNASIHLYDYYQPEMSVTIGYNIPTCNTDVPSNKAGFNTTVITSTVTGPETTVDGVLVSQKEFNTSTEVTSDSEYLTTENFEQTQSKTEDVKHTEESSIHDTTTETLQFYESTIRETATSDSSTYAQEETTIAKQTDEAALNTTTTHHFDELNVLHENAVLRGFVEVEDELDFPDGPEANAPVTVLPPEDFMESNASTIPIFRLV